MRVRGARGRGNVMLRGSKTVRDLRAVAQRGREEAAPGDVHGGAVMFQHQGDDINFPSP